MVITLNVHNVKTAYQCGYVDGLNGLKFFPRYVTGIKEITLKDPSGLLFLDYKNGYADGLVDKFLASQS